MKTNDIALITSLGVEAQFRGKGLSCIASA
jgi:hypothetical protein